jgi:hypothetical protein
VPGKFSPSSLSHSGRKISSIVQNFTHDVTQSTAKIESKLWNVITHSAHHHQNDIEEVDITNDETIQVGDEHQMGASVIGMFDSSKGREKFNQNDIVDNL